MRAKGAYLEHAAARPAEVDRGRDIGLLRKHQGRGRVGPECAVSTSNVASTICGVEDLIPVATIPYPGSLYDRLIADGPKLKVVQDLVGKFDGAGTIPDTDRQSTGSAKCDSYLWAKMHYIDTGKCNPAVIGYWCDAFWLKSPKDMALDNVGLPNHDFVVARRGLHLRPARAGTDEAPATIPTSASDSIAKPCRRYPLSCYKANKGRMIHFSGFTPVGDQVHGPRQRRRQARRSGHRVGDGAH